MDKFNVPKKVNRHVLKAMTVLSDGYYSNVVPMELLCEQVRYQMRKLVAVENVEETINRSLNNMSALGLIECCNENTFALTRNFAPQPLPPNKKPSNPDRKMFTKDPRPRKRTGLNPNKKKTKKCDDDSDSDDDIDRTRRRMRTTKQIRHKGRPTTLPRARQHKGTKKSRGGKKKPCGRKCAPPVGGKHPVKASTSFNSVWQTPSEMEIDMVLSDSNDNADGVKQLATVRKITLTPPIEHEGNMIFNCNEGGTALPAELKASRVLSFRSARSSRSAGSNRSKKIATNISTRPADPPLSVPSGRQPLNM